MGIFYNIFALWTSICLTFLIMGFSMDFKKEDYINVSIAGLIGLILFLLTVLLREIFPKLNDIGLL